MRIRSHASKLAAFATIFGALAACSSDDTPPGAAAPMAGSPALDPAAMMPAPMGTGGSETGTGGVAAVPPPIGGGAPAPEVIEPPAPVAMGGADAAGGAGPAAPGTWSFSKTITLDTTAAGANVDEDIENYPLAVLLNAENFDFSQAQMNGADLRFFDAEGNPLPYAIESWDVEAQLGAAWVFLDVVNGNDNTQSIEMRWGNPTAEDEGDSKAVFKMEHGFYGVWHLNEDGNTDPGGYLDSSDHEAHGDGVGMIPGSQVDARIGKGSHLDNPDGQDTARWIKVTGDKIEEFNSDKVLTVSIWMLAYSYPIRSYETMICKGDTSWSLRRVQYGRNGYQSCLWQGSYHLCSYNFDGQALVTEEWLHFMLVLDEPTMTLYINGERNSSASSGGWAQGDHDLGIGNQTQALGGRRQWDGILDEARVMHGAKSEAWAKLEFESQKESPTLLTFGETQPL